MHGAQCDTRVTRNPRLANHSRARRAWRVDPRDGRHCGRVVLMSTSRLCSTQIFSFHGLFRTFRFRVSYILLCAPFRASAIWRLLRPVVRAFGSLAPRQTMLRGSNLNNLFLALHQHLGFIAQPLNCNLHSPIPQRLAPQFRHLRTLIRPVCIFLTCTYSSTKQTPHSSSSQPQRHTNRIPTAPNFPRSSRFSTPWLISSLRY